jgi:hypothetical protein
MHTPHSREVQSSTQDNDLDAKGAGPAWTVFDDLDEALIERIIDLCDPRVIPYECSDDDVVDVARNARPVAKLGHAPHAREVLFSSQGADLVEAPTESITKLIALRLIHNVSGGGKEAPSTDDVPACVGVVEPHWASQTGAMMTRASHKTDFVDITRIVLRFRKRGSRLHAEVAAVDSLGARGVDPASADVDDLDEGLLESPSDDVSACVGLVNFCWDSQARAMRTRASHMTGFLDFTQISCRLKKMGSSLHAEVAAEDSFGAKGDAASADLDDIDEGLIVSIAVLIVFRDFPIFAGRNAEVPPPADDGPAYEGLVKIHCDSRARVMMTRATLKTRHDAARNARSCSVSRDPRASSSAGPARREGMSSSPDAWEDGFEPDFGYEQSERRDGVDDDEDEA